MAHFPLHLPSEIQLISYLVWLLSEVLPNQLVAVGYELVTNYTHFALKNEHTKCFEV